jgi:hypothetical protein
MRSPSFAGPGKTSDVIHVVTLNPPSGYLAARTSTKISFVDPPKIQLFKPPLVKSADYLTEDAIETLAVMSLRD